MVEKFSINENGETAGIDYKESFASSELFKSLFHEGMDLVKETAAYLDGPGRMEVQGLNRNENLLYTKESMLLTTRLMQMASWLLVHRAVGEGEMTTEESHTKENQVEIAPPDESSPEQNDDLPDGLCNLLQRAHAMQERIARMDAAMREKIRPMPGRPSQLSAQLDQLSAAFSAPPEGGDAE